MMALSIEPNADSNGLGDAAVIVSVIHVIKGGYRGKIALDGKPVDRITAFLFHVGGHTNPNVLKENSGKSFIGQLLSLEWDSHLMIKATRVLATPISDMERLIQENPRNQEAIFPYIGGDEVNSSPIHAHHRYVINFRNWPLRRAGLGSRGAMRMKIAERVGFKRVLSLKITKDQ